MEKNEIHIYNFQAAEHEPATQWMKERLPFAVVGSNTVVSDDQGNLFRGREYPWGVVNIEDEVRIKYEFKAARMILHIKFTSYHQLDTGSYHVGLQPPIIFK